MRTQLPFPVSALSAMTLDGLNTLLKQPPKNSRGVERYERNLLLERVSDFHISFWGIIPTNLSDIFFDEVSNERRGFQNRA